MFIFNRQLFEADPPSGGANPQPPTDPQKSYTPEELQKAKDSAAAAARKEAEAKYAEAQARLDALEAKEKERELANLTEVEKAKKEAEEAKAEAARLKGIEEKLSTYEKSETDRYNKLMDEAEFTDAQKERVNKLPLTDRLEMINDLKAAKQVTPPGGAGKTTPAVADKELAEILAMPEGPDKMNAYSQYRQRIGRA